MRSLLALGIACIALGTPAAIADPGQWSLTGSGVGSGLLAGDHIMVGAHSAVGGADPTGAGEDQASIGTTSFTNTGGHVVCLSVDGNRAVAVWKLRAPYVLPGFTPFDYAGVYIVDNGEPVDGQPVDLMVDYIIHTQNLGFFCGIDAAQFFGAGDAEPLLSGNFVVRDDT